MMKNFFAFSRYNLQQNLESGKWQIMIVFWNVSKWRRYFNAGESNFEVWLEVLEMSVQSLPEPAKILLLQ